MINVCDSCISNARAAKDPIYKLISDTISKLESLSYIDNELLGLLEALIVKISSLLNTFFANECYQESITEKSVETIKLAGSSYDFLCDENRNKTIINVLLSLAGHNIVRELSDLRELPDKKNR